jgi:uncharacterized protein YcgL (UPF0745 family)
MQSWIFKGSRRAETYLYLREGGDTADVPAALLEAMGPLELVMKLTISSERTLARASAEQVIRDLTQNGYYLQMPPPEEKLPVRVQ